MKKIACAEAISPRESFGLRLQAANFVILNAAKSIAITFYCLICVCSDCFVPRNDVVER